MTQVDGQLEQRRKQLLFRAWHRGTRETDLILGRFADARLESLNATEMDEFARLLALPDPDIFNWVSGFVPVPDDLGLAILDDVIAFHRASGRPE